MFGIIDGAFKVFGRNNVSQSV